MSSLASGQTRQVASSTTLSHECEPAVGRKLGPPTMHCQRIHSFMLGPGPQPCDVLCDCFLRFLTHQAQLVALETFVGLTCTLE